MKLIRETPKKALKAFLKQKPLRSEIDLFKANLITLLDKISAIEKRPKDESEEHLKNDLRDFLRDTYYRDTNAINTKDKKDLVIHLGKTTDSEVGVIIEAKRPTNLNEMVSAANANKKALHELILYYLDERNQAGNNQLKQLIITNINEWYIIDANYFDKHIYRNTQIKRLYETKLNDKKDNPFFYEEIAKILAKIDVEIPCIYFDIREYDTILRNNKKEDDRELSALHKILSPQHLLKIATPNDSNSLNEKFYKELLHIIGLEEAKENNKNIIRRKKENRNSSSLIEKTIDSIKTEDVLHRLPDQSIFGESKEERIFNVSLELCITWVNRILFLKLLEGQLITYHQGNLDYRFLNTPTINDFDELFNLFHKVLAVNISDRSEERKAKYNKVPYLNSSLFEISELEDHTIKINALDNGGQLELIGTTILKDTKKKVDKLPTLDYLFQFLDAYDFASEGTEDVQEDNKTIINASVLGKVFEKINGYKDGAIFTPGFITMYMCKQSIRLAVVEKFNEALSEQEGAKLFDKFEDIKNYTSRLVKTQEILRANEIINSLKICDPAVGSGHFLVSSLNEIISIKAELGLLADATGHIFSGYEIEIVNDELIITDSKTNIIEYKLQGGRPLNKEMQRLQKTLFHEKQTIIENCLFGVDINPNSVKICRLRLWIELLKNAYYKEETNFSELETLPNIDINIKCGNSLISRFSLDSDLSKALKSITYSIQEYRAFVENYKNEKNRDVKKGIQKIIDNIKTHFKTHVSRESKEQKKLDKLSEELYYKYISDSLFSKDLSDAQKKNKKDLEEQVTKQKKIIDDINNNIIYKNAFEWRFEFPEVLNNLGEFEGFDIVIGNPPYVFGGNEGISKSNKEYFKENYKSGSGKINLFNLFIEKGFEILKIKGQFSFIIPNTFLRVTSYHEARKLLIDRFKINSISDFGAKVFNEATTTAITLFATKEKPHSKSLIDIVNGEIISNQIRQADLKQNYVIALSIDKPRQEIMKKMKKESSSLGDICKELIFGVVITKNKNEVVSTIKKPEWKPFVEGKDIGQYYVKPIYQYLNYKHELLHRARTKEVFESREKLLIQRITGGSQPLKVAYDDKQLYNKESINNLILHEDSIFNIKYILSLMNSRLINWFYNSQFTNDSSLTVNISKEYLSQIPIKNTSPDNQQPFIALVNQILEAKKKGEDSSTLEKEIDDLVYKLYDISAEEQKLIEGKI